MQVKQSTILLCKPNKSSSIERKCSCQIQSNVIFKKRIIFRWSVLLCRQCQQNSLFLTFYNLPFLSITSDKVSVCTSTYSRYSLLCLVFLLPLTIREATKCQSAHTALQWGKWVYWLSQDRGQFDCDEHGDYHQVEQVS